MATLTLSWKDLNINEDGFNIYRSETPMDISNMPAPIATVSANIGSYDDTTGVVGTLYYYRIGVVKGTDEKISPEIKVFYDNTTVNVHDVFDDGSAVLTYQFNDDITDLGGAYDATWGGTSAFTTGINGSAVDLSNGYIIFGRPIDIQEMSISFWVQSTTTIGNFLECPRFLVQQGNLLIWTTSSPTGSFTRYDGVFSNIVLSEWNHVVFNIRSDHTAEIYINNAVDPIPQGTGTAGNTYSDNTIGNVFTGNLDQLRIFNRILTSNEVDILYQEQFQ